MNPAQDGIDAAKADARKMLLAEKLCEEFKAFVIDSMSDGCIINLDDVTKKEQVLQILKDAMDMFVDMADPEVGQESI